jgi:4-amino-4-deoxy-L-arabinose transferase-like glycosyltransferase
LALIYKIVGLKFGILLPILAGALTVALGFLIARKLFSLEEGIVTASILSFCPILFFTSTKIWIDTTYVFLMVLSFYLFMLAYEKGNYINLIFAGVVFAISILTKYSALGLLLPIVIYAFLKRKKIKDFILSLAIFFAVALAVTTPWFIYYFQKMGSFSYGQQFQITQEYIDMFPFVKMTLQRPDYFYFTQLAIVAPLYILAIASLFGKLHRKEDLILWGWVVVFLASFILAVKLRFLGYALRYMLAITVPLAMLASRTIIRWPKASLWLTIILASYQLVAGILSSYIFYSADIFPIWGH